MKIYVATAFSNIREAQIVMADLVNNGHVITHDWTTKSVDPSWPAPRQAAYLARCGSEDLEGVRLADALVLINHPDCRDSMTEFGIAIGAQKAVGVLYPERRGSVFFPGVRTFETIEGLTAWLGALTLTRAQPRPCKCGGKK